MREFWFSLPLAGRGGGGAIRAITNTCASCGVSPRKERNAPRSTRDGCHHGYRHRIRGPVAEIGLELVEVLAHRRRAAAPSTVEPRQAPGVLDRPQQAVVRLLDARPEAG